MNTTSKEVVDASERMRGFADLLITFGDGQRPGRSRSSAAWLSAASDQQDCDVFTSVAAAGDPNANLRRTASRAGWSLWLLGEVFEYRGERWNTTEHLGGLCEELAGGTAEPQHLNGHFVLFGWEQSRRTWHVWTNRLGTYHVYYGSDGRNRAIGTYYHSVVGALATCTPDWAGITGFCALGFFPGSRTYLNEIEILRPASHAVFSETGQCLQQKRYWEWSHRPAGRSYGETVEEFGHVLARILRDQTAVGRIALPISGGLDSRTVAAIVSNTHANSAAAEALNDRLWAYSYGYTSYSPETAIAREIAQTRGLRFQSFVIGPYAFDRLGLNISSVEGFQDVVSTRQSAVTNDIAEHADYLLAAHWGDVWMDDMGLAAEGSDLEESAILNHTLSKIRKRGREWLLKEVCGPRLGGEDPEGLVSDQVAGELARVAHIDDPDFRVKAFKTDQWSFRRTLASVRMFQPGAFLRLPFYDNRMVDLCCTIPSAFVSGRRLQIDYLKKSHPDLARIPWENTGYSLFRQTPQGAHELIIRACRKLRRAVRRQPTVGRNWEVQFLNQRGTSGLQEWLLRDGLVLHSFVSRAAVRSLVYEMLSKPTAPKGYAVSMLLTLSVCFERYFNSVPAQQNQMHA